MIDREEQSRDPRGHAAARVIGAGAHFLGSACLRVGEGGSAVPTARGSAGGSARRPDPSGERIGRRAGAPASDGSEPDGPIRGPYDGCMPKDAQGKTGRPTETRNKPTRPRDQLGRPQPWDAENTLELEDYDSLTVEENHRLGREHLNAGRFFPAHEAWETAWKQARDTPDAEFFKGLSQLGAGYVHLLRGNAHGAMRLLRRASGRIERLPVGPSGGRHRRRRGSGRLARRRRRAGEVGPGEDAAFVPPRV